MALALAPPLPPSPSAAGSLSAGRFGGGGAIITLPAGPLITCGCIEGPPSLVAPALRAAATASALAAAAVPGSIFDQKLGSSMSTDEPLSAMNDACEKKEPPSLAREKGSSPSLAAPSPPSSRVSE